MYDKSAANECTASSWQIMNCWLEEAHIKMMGKTSSLMILTTKTQVVNMKCSLEKDKKPSSCP